MWALQQPGVIAIPTELKNRLDIRNGQFDTQSMPVSVEQFRGMLADTPLDEVVEKTLFPATPFIFRTDAGIYDKFRNALSVGLAVPTTDITVVGSAALGFSMDPSSFGQRFNANNDSDVDVIVVSQPLFEKAWGDLLAWNHGRKWSMSRSRVEMILSHHHRTIYWGHVWPDILTRISDVTEPWIRSFRGLSREPELAPFNFQGRLYKSWKHALYYHVNSLRIVVSELRRRNII